MANKSYKNPLDTSYDNFSMSDDNSRLFMNETLTGDNTFKYRMSSDIKIFGDHIVSFDVIQQFKQR